MTYVESIPCPRRRSRISSMYKGKTARSSPRGGGRSTGGRHHHLCQWPGDWAGHQQHDHTAGAHQDGEGKGTKEKPKTASSRLSVAFGDGSPPHFGGLYLRQLQLSLRDDISASYGAAVRAADGGPVTNLAAVRAAMASWSSSPMTMELRPITAITEIPNCAGVWKRDHGNDRAVGGSGRAERERSV